MSIINEPPLYKEISQLTDVEKRALDIIIQFARLYPESLRNIATNQGPDGIFHTLRKFFDLLSHK